MNDNKILVFDMDGTIANLYGVENWLSMLRAENPAPYVQARPIYKPSEINSIIMELKKQGWKIVVTTWLAKNSSKEYDKKVRNAKLEWLDCYNFPYDEIHFVKYGTKKANCTRKQGGYQILVDDNDNIRKGWTLGKTINANNNIIAELKNLLTA